ncbi:MAG: citrate transporter [Candidatus Marinimicrobia bacterium CG08_land_8_20_14_0_20_45_22]|nr:MAG: citrate transporter [Candidatus Marinimicrobia bacterium CG08_land_8_20_14_0_20_45_22]
MEIIQITLFIGLFLIISLAMFFRKIPALIALPVMAFLIPLIGGVSLQDTIQLVIGQGTLRLHTAYTVAFFGSMLSIFLQKTKVAENFIKIGAELAGDNPWSIAVLMLSLIALLFTTLGGLGAIIMVATIVLPIMSSIGIGQMTVIGIFLFGLSIGGILNAGNWALYINVMNLSVDEIKPFALMMFGMTFVVALIYITIQLYRDGHDLSLKKIIMKTVAIILIIGAGFLIYHSADDLFKQVFKSGLNFVGKGFKWIIGVVLSTLFIWNILRALWSKSAEERKIHWSAYLTPLIPLFLILLFRIDFIAAFITGLIYGYVATYRKGSLNLFIRSIFEGGAVVMPAIVLMFGIGMLLNAIIGPSGSWAVEHPEGWPVLNLLQPVMQSVIPHSPWAYVMIFGLAAPLALYRGPLNVWGMGYGLAAILLASGMNAGAIMGMLMAVGQVQGISDPTNTHNVWLANEMQQDVQKVLWNTIPYTWAVAILGLIVAAVWFM